MPSQDDLLIASAQYPKDLPPVGDHGNEVQRRVDEALSKIFVVVAPSSEELDAATAKIVAEATASGMTVVRLDGSKLQG